MGAQLGDGTAFYIQSGSATCKLETNGPSGWSADHGGRPTIGHRLLPPILDRRLVSGPLGRFWVTWHQTTSVACPGGSMDPRAHI